MRPSQRVLLGVFPVVACLCFARPAPVVANDAVYEAIDRGVAHLLEKIRGKNPPDWTTDGRNRSLGQVALETYALVVSGVAVDHPAVRSNLSLLDTGMKGSRYTYGLACYVFALDATIAQLEVDAVLVAPRKSGGQLKKSLRVGRAFRAPMARAVAQIIKLQRDAGGWGYGLEKAPEFDNSNVQFAALALGVGAKRGLPIERRVWVRIMDHFITGQQRSGRAVKERIRLRGASTKTVSVNGDVRARGWDYRNRGRSNWSMTNAGLSSLILVRQNIGRSLQPEQRAALDDAIRDGYGWVTTRWSPLRSHYGAYSLEKVGDLGGVELFGKHDWFRELSEGLVATQQADGGWPGGTAHGDIPRVATSFALLILNRASSRLTRDSGSQIVVSGKRGTANDRSWVYVPKIDATIHLPTLLRQIRLRPRLGVVKFLEKVVDGYPPDWRGELLPGLTQLHESSRHSKVRRIISGCLAEITGHRHRDIESYSAWHTKWKRTVELGEQASPKSAAELLVLYRDAKDSLVLKERVIWALERCRAQGAVPLLLADLGHSQERVRRVAYRALRSFFTDLPPSFDASATKSKREAQAAEVRRWCANRTRRSG